MGAALTPKSFATIVSIIQNTFLMTYLSVKTEEGKLILMD